MYGICFGELYDPSLLLDGTFPSIDLSIHFSARIESSKSKFLLTEREREGDLLYSF